MDPPAAPLTERVRFVLVAPGHPGNIGAAARAIRTMGFHRLAVVAPREPDFRTHEEAAAFATHAVDVLQAANSHQTLAQALEGVRLAYAMTGYAREFGPPLVDLRSAAAAARVHLQQQPDDVAFVFGGERNGLANDDLERCSACCAIAAEAHAASLNLAQAVQVTAYECRLALLGGAIAPSLQPFEQEPPASIERIEGLHRHLEQALVALGYLDPAQPRRLMSRLRRLLARAQPTQSEVDILRGIVAAIIEGKSERAGRKHGAR